MTQPRSQSPGVADERSAVSWLLRNPLAILAATLTSYVAYLTISDGWLGAAKAWLAWPTFTVFNLVATTAAFVSVWLGKRAFKQSAGGQRVLHAVVLIVSAVLCVVFLVSAVAALVILALSVMGGSDDDTDSHFRTRRNRRGRRPLRHWAAARVQRHRRHVPHMERRDPRLAPHRTVPQRTHRPHQQPAPSPAPQRPRLHQPRQLRSPRTPRDIINPAETSSPSHKNAKGPNIQFERRYELRHWRAFGRIARNSAQEHIRTKGTNPCKWLSSRSPSHMTIHKRRIAAVFVAGALYVAAYANDLASLQAESTIASTTALTDASMLDEATGPGSTISSAAAGDTGPEEDATEHFTVGSLPFKRTFG